MENKNNIPVGEENLEAVAGGAGDGAMKNCYFTPTGAVRSCEGGTGRLYAQCASNCHGLLVCCCHGHRDNQCVDKWHIIDPVSRELLPISLGNHTRKRPSNNYNT